MTATESQITVYHVWIHLSDNEYQHSVKKDGVWSNTDDNMKGAAQEVFNAHPDKPNMVAHVIEHGGWMLDYYKDGTIVGTANDQAVLSDKAKAIIERLRDAKSEYLPEVWRGRD